MVRRCRPVKPSAKLLNGKAADLVSGLSSCGVTADQAEQFRLLGVVTQKMALAITGDRESVMLKAAVVFLVIALIAGVFGFGGIASASAGMAKVVFGIFIILFLISALFGALKGRAPL
jgi:uncharacterized membrane protein YtjA (UPF0391 family)